MVVVVPAFAEGQQGDDQTVLAVVLGLVAAGADQVLVEPFAIADLVEAVRALGPIGDALLVDLRTGAVTAAPAVADAPWWATR